jgi:hypothetical protein
MTPETAMLPSSADVLVVGAGPVENVGPADGLRCQLTAKQKVERGALEFDAGEVACVIGGDVDHRLWVDGGLLRAGG